jgi:hypothetical protein
MEEGGKEDEERQQQQGGVAVVDDVLLLLQLLLPHVRLRRRWIGRYPPFSSATVGEMAVEEH